MRWMGGYMGERLAVKTEQDGYHQGCAETGRLVRYGGDATYVYVSHTFSGG